MGLRVACRSGRLCARTLRLSGACHRDDRRRGGRHDSRHARCSECRNTHIPDNRGSQPDSRGTHTHGRRCSHSSAPHRGRRVGGALPCQASLKVGDRRLSHTGGAQLLQFLGCQGEAKRTRVALQLLDQGSVQRGLRAKAQDPGHCQRVADGGSQWWRRGATRRHQRGQKQRNASEFLAHDTPSVCGRHCVDLRRRRTFLIVEGWASALGVHQHAPSEMASFLGDFIHHPK